VTVAVSQFPTNQDLDPVRLREAFGTFPSGGSRLTEVDGRPLGLAASSFTSVSLDPPLVSFSIANTSATWPDLRRATHLGITILADHHGAVARQLAGPVEHRFDGLDPISSPEGGITLADGLARFDTTIHQEVVAGDHTIVLLRLYAVQRAEATSPLVFYGSVFRRLMVD
jgi:flavin reductase (DIM6/NTAB) family NADH-FMN oxidoreductase RutF